ncbi:flavodoxin family protein [Bacteroides reticulotermitis]|uniref:Iron-sulfur flavoprotein n=2 Tax=Bacteroides reticulotermitis TaxID=1133319 RepID=W4UX98_9BACE|nr:flavodoxin family protein [Bacteroides reticulotermitis]MBB4045896.1 multimeric flavodoxin WrbA [Bacteroides reticulotermitis]GAE85417.1 iron-sulfur flavoprotein [Bacteroides reticulotermitis JCM 10512]
MIKKLLVISASPRKGGNSDYLSDLFIYGAEEAGHQVEKVFLREKDINYCTACYSCKKHAGRCAIKDDVPAIIDSMIDADVVVLSTPVYFYCMNAQLKTIIDRSVMKWTEIKNKDFYLIATAAEEDDHAMEGTIKSYQGFLECLTNVRDAGHILGKGVYDVGEIMEKPIVEGAFLLGRNI